MATRMPSMEVSPDTKLPEKVAPVPVIQTLTHLYQTGPEAPAEWTFSDEMDYADQLMMIRDGGLLQCTPLLTAQVHGDSGPTKTHDWFFNVVCRDNINQWDKEPAYEVELCDGPAGVTLTQSELDIEDGQFEYIFRDPNRGDGIDNDPCTLTVTATDDNGNVRKMVIHFFIACNELTLSTLEEERHQVDSW